MAALHVEWLKARARALQFLENIRLLYEEMRRAIATTTWIADNWGKKAKARENVSAELKDGLSAYAHEQASAENTLAAQWAKQWALVQDLASGCLSMEELTVRMGQSSTYFSNDDDEDVDLDDPNTQRREEPATIEITIQNNNVQDEGD